MTTLQNSEPEAIGRLQRRKAKTRAAILEAADRLFHSQGFEATSIAQIAEEADTGVGTVYGYFKGKDEMLREVLRKHSDVALQKYTAIVDESTPAIDRVVLALSVFAGFLRENRAILLGAIQASARLVHEDDEQPMQWLVRAYATLLEDGMTNGDLRVLPADVTARALISIYMTAILGVGVWEYHPRDAALEGDLERITRAMLTGC